MNTCSSVVKRGTLMFKRFKHRRLREVSSCNDQGSPATGHFDCNICFESCQDPVVTICGHLFCWACLYKWLSSHTGFQECPVCKARIEDKIIPLYGRGETVCNGTHGKAVSQTTVSIPARPSAPRPNVSITPSHRQNVQVPNFPNHLLSSQRSHLGYGEHFPFPSVGFQANGSPEYNASLLYGSLFGSTTARSLTIQQRSWNIRQEFFLHWLFVLLCFFAALFFLFF